MTTIDLVVILLKCVFAVALVMQLEPLLIWGERKIAAYIQDRAGPNRADIAGVRAGGLVHSLSDVVKLITKEDIRPDHVEKGFWIAAPILAMTVALMTFVVIPWGDQLVLPFLDQPVGLQVASINGGVLYILAVTSLGVYGIMLAGWSSNNKYSLLGGLRSSAQMVSYELAMGLSLVVMFMCFGTVQLDEIARLQSGSIFHWGVFQAFPLGLIAFVVFWVAVFAETNRTPFDLPEAEAELVGGYHTEYSSLRFALFFMAEYANMIVGSAVTATIFFGGYNFPFLDGGQLREYTDWCWSRRVPAVRSSSPVRWSSRRSARAGPSTRPCPPTTPATGSRRSSARSGRRWCSPTSGWSAWDSRASSARPRSDRSWWPSSCS